MSEENHQRALQEPVLVLNATYEPINVTAVRRALVLILKGVATAEEDDGAFIHAARVAVRIPSVIRLLEFRRIPYLEKEPAVARPVHLPVLWQHLACT